MNEQSASDTVWSLAAIPTGFVEALSEAVIGVSGDGSICLWNPAAVALLGYSQSDALSMKISNIVPALCEEIPREFCRADGKNAESIKIETEIIHKDGRIVRSALKVLRDHQGFDEGFVMLARPISRRKQIEQDRERLIHCARLVGKHFLDEAVEVLAEALAVRWVMLCEIDTEHPGAVRTVAFWSDGKLQPSLGFELSELTAFLAQPGETRFFRDRVQERFPGDAILKMYPVESFLRVPLLNQNGQLLGFLAAFHDQQIEEAMRPDITLELFAGRAAAEIERINSSTSAERLGRIVEDAASETFVFDSKTLKFILVNRGARENLGYSMDELRNLTPLDIKPDIPPKAFMDLIKPLKSGEKQVQTFETIHRRKDGSDYDVLVKLQLLRDESRPVFYAAIEDVTERNSRMRDLQMVTSRLDTILNNTTMSVFMMNANQECIYMNGAAESLTGFTFEETQGRTLHDVIHHHYEDGRPFPIEECEIDRALPDHSQVQGEGKFIHKDGHFYPVAFTASPIQDANGNAIGTVIEARNIEEEIRARESIENFNAELSNRVESALKERDEAEAQLRHAQKMEAVGKLTGGVAHDFNNLLQVIGGSLDLLRRDLVNNPRGLQRLDLAAAGVERGAKLAQQLLAFSRKQPLAPKVCDLGRLIRNLGDMLQRTLGEHIRLTTLAEEGSCNSFIDAAQMENAILNLAINARDAMDDNGALNIEVSRQSVDQNFARQHVDMTPGEYVLVSVSDTGCGMSDEIRDRIFEPFFTTKEIGKGTGLGLSMVYGLVKQSGGQIVVSSEIGKGTTISIYLPYSAKQELVSAPRTSQVTGGSETILVVEDDHDVRSTVVALLHDLGYRVLAAGDGAAGLAIIESGAKIDLLFSDVIMPGEIQSHQLASRAKQLIPGLPALYTSGYTENSIVHAGKLDEGVELISKPYSHEALARRLRECFDQSNFEREKAESVDADLNRST